MNDCHGSPNAGVISPGPLCVPLFVGVVPSRRPAGLGRTVADAAARTMDDVLLRRKGQLSNVDDFLKWLQDNRLVEDNDGAAAPVAAFLSVIFSANPTRVEDWVQTTKASGKTKDLVAAALWLSGNVKMASEMSGHPIGTGSPIPLADIRIEHPSHLDMMWGAFFASGDTVYVQRIIETLDDTVPLTGDATLDAVIRGAAEWSLGSNMAQHELVNRLVRKELAARSGTVKAKLAGLVGRMDQDKPLFPNSDGAFSAMMVVADEKTLAGIRQANERDDEYQGHVRCEIRRRLVDKDHVCRDGADRRSFCRCELRSQDTGSRRTALREPGTQGPRRLKEEGTDPVSDL